MKDHTYRDYKEGELEYLMEGEKRYCNVIQLIGAALVTALAVALAFLFIFLFSSCSHDDRTEGTVLSVPRDAITFGVTENDTVRTVPSVRSGTRTAQGTMTLDGTGGTESLKEKGFGVFACHTGVHPYVSTSTTSNMMWNQQVSYDLGSRTWTYTPIVYWPNEAGEADQYVTFFAYGPHSDRANGCIADMSRPEEVGDPWILYQLGGKSYADGEDGWKARQVDLLYDFKKDQKRTFPISSNKIIFDFKHALACIGDQINVSVGESAKTRLKGIYYGSPVTLTVSTITIDYQLTRKGRLVLNSSGQPNWQAVDSEDSKVHRTLVFTPNLVMAKATSSSACTTTGFSSGAGHGVFYIPLESGSNKQKVTVSAEYTITTGSPVYVVSEGTIEATVDLSYISNASEGRNLNVTIQIPEIECSGASLASASVGQIICSHGKVFPATVGDLVCGGKKVAVVAYKGNGSGESSPYNNGLAIALKDAAVSVPWCNQSAANCLPSQYSGLDAALNHKAGISATNTLAASAEHQAATSATGYQYDASVSAGAHPDGTSQWFLPTMGQWNLMVKAMTGSVFDLSGSGREAYKAAGFNANIEAVGGTGVLSALYWSSTESSAANAWYMSFEGGKTNSSVKTGSNNVRAILAF